MLRRIIRNLIILIWLPLISGCFSTGYVDIVDYVATEVRDHGPRNKFKMAIRAEWQYLENDRDHHFMTINVSHKDYESMYDFACRQQKHTPFLTIYFFAVAEAAIHAGSHKTITNQASPFLVAEYRAEPSPIYFRQFPKGFFNAKSQSAYGVKDFPQ